MDVSFKARPIAAYKPFKDSTARTLTIYSLEPADIPFLESFNSQIVKNDSLKAREPVYHEIIMLALKSILNGLKIRDKFKVNDQSVAYISVAEGRITSIFQGNAPKLVVEQNKIVHSYRNCPNESEIDWLTVIPSNDDLKLPKSAAASVVAEFFSYCFGANKKISNIFCRSELPERCEKSAKFYKKIGFRQIGDRMPLEDSKHPIDLGYFLSPDNFEYSSDKVIPMLVKKQKAQKSFRQISLKFGRQEINATESVDLASVVTQQ